MIPRKRKIELVSGFVNSYVLPRCIALRVLLAWQKKEDI